MERGERLIVLDEELHEVEEIASHWAEKARVLRCERNKILPMFALSLELLQEIFLQLFKIHNAELNVFGIAPGWHWFTVTWVCQRWRDAAIGYPRLWTLMHKIRNTEKLKKFLERSQQSGLIVRFGDDFNIGYSSNPSSISLMKHFYDHIGRFVDVSVTTFSYSGSSEWGEVQKLFAADSFPRLKKLRLFFAPDKSRRIETSSFDKPWMRLDVLHLRGVVLPWNHNITRGLSELILDDMLDSIKPTFSELLVVLEGCPALRKLILRDAGPIPNFSFEAQPELVNLPQLEHLEVASIDFEACESFVNSLEFPVSTHWTFSCLNYPFLSPVPVLSKLCSKDSKYDHVYVTLDDDSISFRGNSEDEDKADVRFKLDRNMMFEFGIGLMLDCVGSILSQQYWAKARAISFLMSANDSTVVDWGPVERPHWEAFFEGLQRFTDVSLDFYSDFSDNCLLVLADSPGSPPVLKCPDMERLRVAWRDLMDQNGQETNVFHSLMENLKLRKQCGKWLKRLRFMYCVGINNENLQRLMDMGVAEGIDLEIL